ncbi:probable inorganic phosphate transporter 1-4 [Musa acuminata AAA Group]|uniref:probable inorganic phosphate transporter 1-4 n=1 Tax=Musa acuminata AAA Group TaxID=214697 RepID=UPI0031D6FCA5
MAGGHLQVLGALDLAKTRWYHFTATVIAGMGFFTDAYDLFCISLVTKLLGRIYSFDPNRPGRSRPTWLGDKLGRKKVYGMTLMLMVICSIICLGFGIGGDYLLSATIMSEYANKKTRGAFIAVVFTTQGFGILTGGIVSIIISAAFKERFDYPAYRDDRAGSTVPEADYIWCTTLMLGALPVALTYYWRMKMPETARYTALVAKNAKRAAPECRGIIRQAQACSPLTSGSIGLVCSQRAASLPRSLGLMRSKQPAASATWPHTQPTSCLAASVTRPHAQQAARCLGHLATCAANTLPRSLGPRPLGLMHSKQSRCRGHSASCAASEQSRCRGHSASCAAGELPRCLGHSTSCAASSPLPRPLGHMCSQHAASQPRPLGPRPLGLMHSKQPAASAPQPHAQQAA